jgi:glycosyltransferase involved in cell wall biosynthesis
MISAQSPKGYLAFLGRISPEKRPDRAIEIAKRLGKKLKIAAKVDAADRAYFDDEIEPLMDDPLIEFVGEIGDSRRSRPSWAAPTPCCSRSTGPSPSAW